MVNDMDTVVGFLHEKLKTLMIIAVLERRYCAAGAHSTLEDEAVWRHTFR